AREGVGRSSLCPVHPDLHVFAVGVSLGSFLRVLLRHFFVLGGLIRGGRLALLRRTFVPHGGIAHRVTGRLLASAEDLVEKSHPYPPCWGWRSEGTLKVLAVPQKTPKPANPRVHRLWLEEYMAAQSAPSSTQLREKSRTLRTSVGSPSPVGTLT